MKETQIARENVKSWMSPHNVEYFYRKKCYDHKSSCERNVEKRERDSKYLHKLVKEGIRGNHFLRYVDRIDKELKDNQNAIKIYEENGIK